MEVVTIEKVKENRKKTMRGERKGKWADNKNEKENVCEYKKLN